MIEQKTLDQIDKYKIIRRIADGSSGVVYLSEHEGKQVAIKLIKAIDPDVLVRFRRESSTLARLNHENLIKIFDVGEFQGSPFLVMEYLEGNSLDLAIEAGLKPTELQCIDIGLSVAKALTELHKNNLVHRDIKLANTYLAKDGRVRLIDLGLVGDVEQIKTETAIVGTPVYCSPEQAKILKRPVDFRSDLYSLGVTLFTALAGRTPFVGSVTEILQQHASKVAPDPRDFNPGVSAGLSSIIAKLLAKEPDSRYQSAAGLIFDLNRVSEIDQLIKAGQDPQLGKKDRKTLTTKVKFVDRTAETQRLRAVRGALEEGRPSLAIVSGASGSGKTRLTEEFIESTRTSKDLLLRSKCQFFDRDLPFGPIREALDSLLEEISSLPAEAKAHELGKLRAAGRGFEGQLISLSRSLRRVFPDYVVSGENQSNVDGDRELFFSNVSQFFVRLCDGWERLILFIDDLQWLDRASLQLLQKIFENAQNRKVLLLGTARDDQESLVYMKNVEENLGFALRDNVHVDSFTSRQMADLVCGYLGSGNVGTEIPESIGRLSKGNPFIAIEYLRAGIEQGFLNFHANNWHLNREALERIALSENVYELIIKRIESSSTQSKEFLQYAALFGNSFQPADIARVVGLTPAETQEIVQSCQEFALIERVNSVRFKFIHDKIPESLASSLSAERIQEVSGCLARYFFGKDEKSADEIFTVARLFARSGLPKDTRMAIAAHIEAGHLAAGAFAFSEAYGFYKFAYQGLKADADGQGGLLLEIAPKLAISATMVQDESLATECVNYLIDNVAPGAPLAHAMALKVWILNTQSQTVSAWEHFKRVTQIIGKPYPLYLHWKVIQTAIAWAMTIILDYLPLRVSTRLYFKPAGVDVNQISNMFREAQFACEIRANTLDFILLSFRLLVMGQLVGGLKERALGYASVGFVYGMFGLKSLQIAYAEKAKTCSDALNDPTITALCEMRRLFGSLYCGVLKDFYGEYLEKRELFHKYLSPAELGRFVLQIGYFYGFRGLHNEAIEAHLKILDDAEKKIIRLPQQNINSQLNQIWWQMFVVGRNQDAQKIRDLALVLNNQLRYNPSSMRSMLNMEVSLRRISRELSLTTEEIAVCWWHRSANKLADPPVNNLAALLAYIRLYQLEDAKTLDERLSALHELKSLLRHTYLTLYCPMFRANYYLVRGAYYRVQGNFAKAEKFYGQAEAAAGSSGALRVLHDLQVERARIHRKTGNLELMKLNLSAAVAMAIKNKWQMNIDLLSEEFENYIEVPEALANRSGSTVHGTIAISKTVQVSSTRHVSAKSAHGTSVAGRSSGTRVMGSVDLEEQRFLQALLNVSHAFATSLDRHEQSKAVLSELVKLFAAERGFLFAANEEGTELNVVLGKNADGMDLQELGGFSNTVVKKVFSERKPVIVSGTDEGEVLGSESVVLRNLRSIMATPLISKDKILGVVYLDSTLAKGLFTQGDIDIFSSIANHISVTFELSRMAQVQMEKMKLEKALEVQSAIATEARKVKILVENMRQAVFSVGPGGTIVEPVSSYSKTIFGDTPLAGHDIMDVLYGELQGHKEQYASVRSALDTVFGESDLQWDLSESSFPKRILLAPPSGVTVPESEKRVLKVSPSPIWDGDQNLERILFVVEDVTTLEAMERQASEHRIRAAMLEDILENDLKELRTFFDYASKAMAACRHGIEKLDSARFVALLRELHTFKGNARLSRLKILSEQIHNSETALARFSGKEELGPDAVSAISAELGRIETVSAQYKGLLDRIFQVNGAEGDRFGISPAMLREVELIIEEVSRKLPDREAEKLRRGFERLSLTSVHKLVSKFSQLVDSTAARLEKKAQLEVQGEAYVDEAVAEVLRNCLVHLIGNALTHGLEGPQERVRAGKSESGRISVGCVERDDSLEFTVQDDGRGIDPEIIARKAVEKGLVSPEAARRMSRGDKINLIFLPGFSTADTVTDVAGRGVGMDAVKQAVEDAGGTFEVQSGAGEGSAFRIILKRTIRSAPSQRAMAA